MGFLILLSNLTFSNKLIKVKTEMHNKTDQWWEPAAQHSSSKLPPGTWVRILGTELTCYAKVWPLRVYAPTINTTQCITRPSNQAEINIISKNASQHVVMAWSNKLPKAASVVLGIGPSNLNATNLKASLNILEIFVKGMLVRLGCTLKVPNVSLIGECNIEVGR